MLQIASMSFLVLVLSLIAFCSHTNVTASYLQMPDGIEKDRIIYQKYVELDRDIKKIVGNAVKSVLPFIMEANENLNISSSCSSQLFQLVSGVKKLQEPYVKILDASGKPPSGILTGNFHMLGDYDECITTSVLRKDGSVAFKGQYCMLLIRPSLPKRKRVLTIKRGLEELIEHTKNTSDVFQSLIPILTVFYYRAIKYGMCIPSGCSSQDVNFMLNYLSEKSLINATAEYCDQQDEFTIRTPMMISICAFSLVGLLAVIGSSMDYYSMKKKVTYQSTVARFLLCFSVPANFPNVITTKTSEDSLKCIHGIRCMGLFYVILAHQFLTMMQTHILGHMFVYKEEFTRFFFQILTNSVLTVETFFFIGGLVNSYVRMKYYDTGNRKLSIIKIIMFRLFRIYPAYIFGILLTYLFENVRGPSATLLKKEFMEKCETKWWQNLLFINNFFHQMDTCMINSWYLAADMHLFLLSLLTIPALFKNAKKGIILHLGVIAAGLTVTTLWVWHEDLMPVINVGSISENDILKYWNGYASTFPHIAPYYTGILVGYMLYRWKELKISLIVQIIGWPVAAACFISIIFVPQKWSLGVEYTWFESALYFAFGRFLFALAVAWMVVCCSRGYGGIINYILCLKMWIPISRLSLMMYVISISLQMQYFSSSKMIIDSDRMTMIWRYIGDLGISGLTSLVMVTLIESPVIALQKLLLQGNLKTEEEDLENNVNAKSEINDEKFSKDLEFENNLKNTPTKL